MFKVFKKWIMEEKLTAISTTLCFMAVALISTVKIEGIILMIMSQIGWTIWAYKGKFKFMIIQNSVLMVIDIFGVYFWITSGKGSWFIIDVLNYFV